MLNKLLPFAVVVSVLAAMLFVAPAAAIDPLVPAFHKLATLAVAKSRGSADIACPMCEDLADAFYELARDKKDLNATVGAILRQECVTLFGTNEADLEACNAVVRALIRFLEWGAKEMDDWKVNFRGVVCSDFIKVCVHPCCNTPYDPEQLRLSFGGANAVGEVTSMGISWITLNETAVSQVKWRVAGSGSRWNVANGSSHTYHIGGWLGVIHTATMTELLPGTQYEYLVGADGFAWSATPYTFTTLGLDAGTPQNPLNFVGIADMGWGNYSDATVRNIEQLAEQGRIAFVLHTGDISYFDGYDAWWDLFGRKVEAITRRVPYMTAPGNHEQIWWNATSYKARWQWPAAAGAPADATYYALSFNGLRLVVLDSETVWNTPNFGPAQVAWLEGQLRAANAAKQMIFTTHHRPMYASESDEASCLVLRQQAEELYYRHGVAFVMVGHVHSYMRTLPVYNRTVMGSTTLNATAPVYAINGAAGNREGVSDLKGREPWTASVANKVGFATFSFVAQDRKSVV